MSQPGIDSRTRYFRSLDELQKTPEFQGFLDREFPQAASEFPEGVSRRRWLQLMGASLALGGLSGCRYNREEVAAFVMRPEGRIPGIPEYFATNFEWAGRVVHALVANVDGRPLKVDGNADHPAYSKFQPKETAGNKKLASAGTDVYTQGAILSLYDQDRLGIVLNRTVAMAKPTIANSESDDVRKQTWDAFSTHVANSAAALGTGKGLAILIEPTRSPSFWTVLKEVLKKYPEATVVKYESVYTGNVGKALDAVGATNCSMVYDLDQAKVIVALDSDLLGSDPNAVQYSRQYANHRDPGGEWMNRLYCVESQYSVTGTAADFRLAMQASQIEALLSRIEKAIDAGTIVDDKVESTTFENLDADGKISRMIECIASDLLANKGSAVLAVGAHHSLAAQVAAIRINVKLGNIGKTVKIYENPADINSIKSMKLDDFVVDVLEKSSFNSLWVLAPNPVFSVSGDVDLSGAMKKIADVVYLSHYDDETAYYANWTVPANHPLESWGDVRATDGTLSICQPTIAPLLGGKTATELLAMLAGLSAESLPGNVIIAETAEKLFGKDTAVKRSSEQIANLRKMREALHAGFVAGSESKLYQGELKADPKELQAESEKEIGSKLSARNYMLPDTKLSLALDMGSVEVLVLPSDTIYDGRLGNNGWLQECPHPVTKLTWDNAAICSPATAKAMGLKQGELVVLSLGDSKVKLPLFVVPGHAEGSFTVNYGYGHSKQFGGSISGAVGTDLSTFRRWNQSSLYTGVSVKPTGEPYRLATTQDHFALDDLGQSETAKRAPQLIREGTYFEYKEKPEFTKSVVDIHTGPSLWEEPKVDENHKWGMAIDLNKCTGCNSCVVACQAENNVPIVGKEQVLRGREMHWLRIDRYFQADVTPAKSQAGINQPLDAKVVMQPMACAHCETAPCEQVCPVAATVHTEEGINAMAYNRCIGTRYCANNCPYKVRRFNYFNYNDEYGYFYGWQDKREQASKKLQSLVLNPEVTVRGRGVMEKCTYCIQRVQNGKIYARSKGDGRVHDGDIRSACQDACPTGAIVFGDLNDKTSRVHSLHEDPRSYAVLEELNIKPRTLYLSRIRNVPKRLATESQLSPARPGHGHEHEHNH